MKTTAIGFDLAKNVFQVHGVDERGQTSLRKKLQRAQVAVFFAKLTRCLVGIEACGTSIPERTLEPISKPQNCLRMKMAESWTKPRKLIA